MIELIRKNLVIFIVGLVTMGLLVGGVFIFSKQPEPINDSSKVASNILIGSDSYATSGYVDGKYLPADPNAKITIVEFGDYQCPACQAYEPLTQSLLTEFSGKITFVFRHYPLPQHKNARITAYAAEAAGIQGKYWEMHHLLYEKQEEWSEKDDIKTQVIEYAKILGLDDKKFSLDIDSKEIMQKIERDRADGELLNVNSTPTFFVDRQKIGNTRSYEAFKKIVEDALNSVTLESGEENYHTHFDIKTYVKGVEINFAQDKYQSSKDNPLSEQIHFHDGQGKSAHIHTKGVALKTLFDSIKVSFGTNTSTNNLKVYVNGKLNSEGLDYQPQDLDQILVSYGPINDPKIGSQLESVTDVACIYSEKCPERGTPPSEECVGGLGTECE